MVGFHVGIRLSDEAQLLTDPALAGHLSFLFSFEGIWYLAFVHQRSALFLLRNAAMIIPAAVTNQGNFQWSAGEKIADLNLSECLFVESLPRI